MACKALTTITKSCDNNVGGIYTVWVNDTENVTVKTADEATHMYTALTALPIFTGFEFSRNTGSLTVEPMIDLINGSTYFQATVTLVFHRREAAKSAALQILGEGQRYLDIIVQDALGQNWYVDHAQLSGGQEGTGVAKGDGSKYEVTFVADMNNRPYGVDNTVLTTVIA